MLVQAAYAGRGCCIPRGKDKSYFVLRAIVKQAQFDNGGGDAQCRTHLIPRWASEHDAAFVPFPLPCLCPPALINLIRMLNGHPERGEEKKTLGFQRQLVPLLPGLLSVGRRWRGQCCCSPFPAKGYWSGSSPGSAGGGTWGSGGVIGPEKGDTRKSSPAGGGTVSRRWQPPQSEWCWGRGCSGEQTDSNLSRLSFASPSFVLFYF